MISFIFYPPFRGDWLFVGDFLFSPGVLDHPPASEGWPALCWWLFVFPGVPTPSFRRVTDSLLLALCLPRGSLIAPQLPKGDWLFVDDFLFAGRRLPAEGAAFQRWLTLRYGFPDSPFWGDWLGWLTLSWPTNIFMTHIPVDHRTYPMNTHSSHQHPTYTHSYPKIFALLDPFSTGKLSWF